MKRENTIRQNVEFLLSMYKREYSSIDKDIQKGERTWEEKEMIECTIIELETILEYDNGKI